MICAVYKSAKKADTYLYLIRRDDFSCVPTELMGLFGKPQFVMLLPLESRERLALVDKHKLQDALQAQGYFLQLPPPEPNLLQQHRQQLGLEKHP
ncbi:YcgL domain-containing protein [Pseudaeromonas sharmana]|uniref:YcgL domain-containing protein ACFOSS_11615 n=1 Tax=Pseudaeromonas sharmana TaxID=328412 RepID=A0ABV8CQ34_9GAMM